jgi:hypothetical protein
MAGPELGDIGALLSKEIGRQAVKGFNPQNIQQAGFNIKPIARGISKKGTELLDRLMGRKKGAPDAPEGDIPPVGPETDPDAIDLQDPNAPLGETPPPEDPNAVDPDIPIDPMAEKVLDDIEAGENVITNPEGRVEKGSPEDVQRNINLKYFPSKEQKNLVDIINKAHGGFAGNRIIDKVSVEETLAQAVTPEVEASAMAKVRDLNDGNMNVSLTPAETARVYMEFESAIPELLEAAKEVQRMRNAGETMSQDALSAFAYMFEMSASMAQATSATAALAGRNLNIINHMVDQSSLDLRQKYKTIQMISENTGGPDGINGMADTVVKMMGDADPDKPETWMRKAWGLFTSYVNPENLQTLRYNMMLSSIRTHVANVTGSSIAALYEIPVGVAARGFNAIEYHARATASKLFDLEVRMDEMDRMTLRDQFYGEQRRWTEGASQGIRAFATIAKGGEAPDGQVGKVWNDMGIRWKPGEDMSLAGKVLTTPTRLLEAEDAFFRSVFHEQRLSELIARQAMAEGGTKKAIKARMAELTENPPTWMKDKALEYSQKMTFTNDPSMYGTLLSSISNGLQGFQQSWIGNLMVPFVRTPANLFGYAIEATGMNLFKSGKAIMGDDPAARADALARSAIAVGLFVWVEDLMDDEVLTGVGPESYGKKKVWEMTGWREGSFCPPDGSTCYQLNRTDPLGLTLLIMATTIDAAKTARNNGQDASVIAAMGVLAVTEALNDRSMLTGLSQLLEIIDGGSPKALGSLTIQAAQSYVVPNFLRDFREAGDPYRRSMAYDGTIDGLMGRFKKSIMNATMMSDEIPMSLDAWGRPIMTGGDALWRGVLPIRQANIRDGSQDPATAASILAQLDFKTPSPTLNIGRGYTMNLLEFDDYDGFVYNEYIRILGDTQHKVLNQVVTGSAFKRLVKKEGSITPDGKTGTAMKKAQSDSRLAGNALFIKWLLGREKFTPSVMGEDGKQIYLMEEGADGKEKKVIKEIETPWTKDELNNALDILSLKSTPEEREAISDLIKGGRYRTRMQDEVPGAPASVSDILESTLTRKDAKEQKLQDPDEGKYKGPTWR